MLRAPIAAVVLVAVAALPACDAERHPPLELRGLDGGVVRPLETAGLRAAVLLFTRTDCPISNRYAPEVRRLDESYAPRGVGFWLVYVDPDEPSDAIRAHLKEYGYPMEALRDPGHAVALRVGAEVTPEAAVFTPDGRLAYLGRIDDRYTEFGRSRPEPTRHDVAEALDAVLDGRPVELARAPAVGCTIADLR